MKENKKEPGRVEGLGRMIWACRRCRDGAFYRRQSDPSARIEFCPRCKATDLLGVDESYSRGLRHLDERYADYDVEAWVGGGPESLGTILVVNVRAWPKVWKPAQWISGAWRYTGTMDCVIATHWTFSPPLPGREEEPDAS